MSGSHHRFARALAFTGEQLRGSQQSAEEPSADDKTVQNSAKQCKTVQNSDFGAKTSRYSSKFKFFNSKFEFQASFCITNLKHHTYEASAEYGRRGGLHRRENVEKQCKTVQNSDFGAKTSSYSSKFKFLNSKFEFRASFCITNRKYYTYEASAEYGHRGGLHRRENVEKQCKTVQNSILAPKRPLQLKIQIFELKI